MNAYATAIENLKQEVTEKLDELKVGVRFEKMGINVTPIFTDIEDRREIETALNLEKPIWNLRKNGSAYHIYLREEFSLLDEKREDYPSAGENIAVNLFLAIEEKL